MLLSKNVLQVILYLSKNQDCQNDNPDFLIDFKTIIYIMVFIATT